MVFPAGGIQHISEVQPHRADPELRRGGRRHGRLRGVRLGHAAQARQRAARRHVQPQGARVFHRGTRQPAMFFTQGWRITIILENHGESLSYKFLWMGWKSGELIEHVLRCFQIDVVFVAGRGDLGCFWDRQYWQYPAETNLRRPRGIQGTVGAANGNENIT